MAVTLRNNVLDMSLPACLYALLGTSTLFYPRLHLVKAESRHPVEFPGTHGVHCSLPPVGIDGLQSRGSWYDPQG